MSLFITHALPMLAGYAMRLIAIIISNKQQQQARLLDALTKQTANRKNMYQLSQNESPKAARNRRIIILSVLSFIAFYVGIGLFTTSTIEVVEKGYSLFGLIPITNDSITHKTLSGVVVYKEIFEAFMIIIEFYMGGQLAKQAH